jgi:hypothetical protein
MARCDHVRCFTPLQHLIARGSAAGIALLVRGHAVRNPPETPPGKNTSQPSCLLAAHGPAEQVQPNVLTAAAAEQPARRLQASFLRLASCWV